MPRFERADPHNRIDAGFRQDFAKWGLELPIADLQSRRSGFIQSHGWLVQYVFGRNRFGEYLDYYASHRMTDDRHVRLYHSGRQQYLTALTSMDVTSSDPNVASRSEAAFFRRNRRVARALIRKGFDKFTVNMSLRSGAE